MARINSNLGDSGLPMNPGPNPPGGSTVRDARDRGAVGPRIDASRVSQRIDVILRVGFSHRPQRTDYPTDSPLSRAVKFHEAALALLGNFAREAGRVVDDAELSPIGRTKRLAFVGSDFLKRLDDLATNEPMLPTLRRMRDKSAAEVRSAIKFPAADDLGGLLREREIRDRLYAMDSGPRHEAFRRIIDARDPLGLAAVVNAPVFAPLFPARIVEEGVREVAEAIVPDAAKTRAESEEAIASIEAVRDDARAMIAESAGVDVRQREGLSAADRGREAVTA